MSSALMGRGASWALKVETSGKAPIGGMEVEWCALVGVLRGGIQHMNECEQEQTHNQHKQVRTNKNKQEPVRTSENQQERARTDRSKRELTGASEN